MEKSAALIGFLTGIVIAVAFYLLGIGGLDDYESKVTKEEKIISITKTETGSFEVDYENEADRVKKSLYIPKESVEIKDTEKDYEYFIEEEKEYNSKITRAAVAVFGGSIGHYKSETTKKYTVYLD